MTAEHHIAHAAEVAISAVVWLKEVTPEDITDTLRERFIRKIIVAAHHALAAQHCRKCNGSGIYRFGSNQYCVCHYCGAKGWIPRFADVG